MSKRKPTYEELERRGQAAEEALAALVSGNAGALEGEETQRLIKDLGGDVRAILRLIQNSSALSKSEAALKEMQQIARMGRWELNLADNRLQWSETIYAIFEIDPKQFHPSYKTFINLVHPDDREKVDRLYRDSVANKSPYEIAHRLLLPEGRIKWVNEIGRTEYDAKGKPIRSIGIVQDITDRVQAEEALRSSEEKFRAMVEQAAEMLFLHDMHGRIVDVNRAAVSQTGYTRDELLRMRVSEIDADVTDPDDLINLWNSLRLARTPLAMNRRHQRKDGTIYPAEVTISLVHLGSLSYIVALARDISDRIEAENALRTSEENFRSLFNAIHESVFMIDAHGTILAANETFAERLGRSADASVGRCVYDIIPPEAAARRKPLLDKAIETGKPTVFEDERQGRWLRHSISPIQDAGGNVQRLVIYAEDITERRRANEALAFQARVLDQIQDRVTVTDLDGYITYVNDSECRMMGMPREALIGKHVSSYGEDPAVGATQVEIIQETLEKGEWNGEVVNFRPDGSPIVLHCRTQLMRNEQGEATGMCGIATDITERKQAAERLRMMAEALDEAPSAITVHDLEGSFLYANRKTFTMHGYTEDEFMGLRLQELDTPESAALIPQRIKQIAVHGEACFEVMHYRKDGTTVPLEIYAKQVEWHGVPALLSIATDITERKRADKSLRESTERLQSVFRAAPVGIGVVRDRILLEANARLCEMTGYSQDELIGKSSRFLYPSQEEFDYVGAEKYRQIREKGTGTVETRWQRKDGAIMDVVLSSTPLQQADLSKGVTFAALDITERKRAEAALEETSLRLQESVRAANVGLWDWDLRTNAVSYSREWKRQIGYEEDEIGDSFEEWESRVHPDDLEPTITRVRKAISDLTQNYHVEFRFRHKDGSYRWILSQSSVICDDAGQPVRVIGSHIDVTASKTAADALRESEQKYRLLVENANSVILRMDNQGNVTFFNKFAQQYFGYSEAEILGKNVVGTIVPEQEHSGRDLKVLIEGILKDPDRYNLNENENMRKDGSRVWTAWTNKGILDSGGNLVEVLCIGNDITARKRAEEALKASQERFQKMLDLVPDMISIHDTDMNIVYSNWRGFGDIPQERRILHTKCHKAYRNSDAICPDCQANSVLERKQPFQSEMQLPDGVWIDLRVIPLLDEEGNVELFMEWVRDITGQKRAERALQEALVRQETAVKAGNVGLWDWDLKANKVYYSPEWKRQIGYEDHEIGDSIAEWQERVHPDDLPEAAKTIQRHLESICPSYQLEFRFRHKNGSYRWILAQATIFRDDSGVPIRVMGSHVDISEHKHAEEALRHRVEIESFMAEASIHCITMAATDLDAVIDGILQQAGILLGADRSYIFLLNNKSLSMDNTHEWCAPGICSFRESLQGIPQSTIPWWMDQLRQSKTIHIPDVSAMDEDMEIEKVILEAQEVQSLVVVPIAWQRKLRGFLGLDMVRERREWSDEDRRALETLANTLALVFERKRAEEERTRAEEQLRQAQKMEAVGRLAGGVAHDFNNMLGVILGHVEMALMEIEPEHPLHAALSEVQKAGERSADLTRQLLAFARKQTITPRVLDLNDTIVGMLKMLQRLIGENIDLAWLPGHGLWPVRLDPSQIDQILANLIVNARDAIGGMGRVTIETQNEVIGDEYSQRYPDAAPGNYVMLSVNDTGCGMTPQTMALIFEPFFTTKPMGEGTGLGLATVYGSVRQSNGFITVHSEPGKGATFKVFFPRHGDQLCEDDLKASINHAPIGGTETVLLVEDEKALLDLARLQMEVLGYTVLTANNPKAAVKLMQEYPHDIHLLLTDVVMPQMNGRDLWRQCSAMRPGLKCLFMSGYTADAIAHHSVLDAGVCFLPKPFSIEALSIKLREALSKE